MTFSKTKLNTPTQLYRTIEIKTETIFYFKVTEIPVVSKQNYMVHRCMLFIVLIGSFTLLPIMIIFSLYSMHVYQTSLYRFFGKWQTSSIIRKLLFNCPATVEINRWLKYSQYRINSVIHILWSRLIQFY